MPEPDGDGARKVGERDRKARGPAILIASNGHGEDAMGALLARRLAGLASPSSPPGAGAGELRLLAAPLVGQGDPYRAAGLEIAVPLRSMPSGGFGFRAGGAALGRDLRAGLLGLMAAQIRALRRLRPQVDLALCVGDIYPVLLCAAAGLVPVVLVATARSVHIRPHGRFELWAMRRYARGVYARDEPTARELASQRIPARWAGNLMMDLLEEELSREPGEEAPHGETLVALLPGSRAEAPENLATLLEVAQSLAVQAREAGAPWAERLRFAAPLAPQVDRERCARAAVARGWERVERPEGIALRRSGCEAVLVESAFARTLAASRVVIGLAGTASEQAAGLGKPVVTFAGAGVQCTPRFVAAQGRLLGAAVTVTEPGPDLAAAAALRLLSDPALYEAASREGRNRMGPPGGAGRIAAELLAELFVKRSGGGPGRGPGGGR